MAEGGHFDKKNVKCDISAAIRPILVKFGTMMHLSLFNLTGNQICQNFIIEDGGRWPSWKSKNHDISETIWPILTKFCTMAHISRPKITCSCSKIKPLKIQDGGRPPFKKTLNAISQQPFDQFWWNLVHRCILGLPIWRSSKNFKISKSRWRTAAILKIKKIEISWKKRLSDFDEILHDDTY